MPALQPHYLRFVKALTLAALAAPTSCASVVGPADASPEVSIADAARDVTPAPDVVDTAPPDAVPNCDCCPRDGTSGNCIDYSADGGPQTLPPPPGHRWCVGAENLTAQCPVEGPLPPPDFATA